MAVLTQIQIAEQMVAQMRLLNPSISGEVGTPERLILDTASGAIAEDQINLLALQQALNIDTKFGSNLTNFLALFGFARQEATVATGYVVFSRNAPSNYAVSIPSGIILKAPRTEESEEVGLTLQEFSTNANATIEAGATESGPVPIRASNAGEVGNVPANTITIMSLNKAIGVTAVTNPTATTGGKNQEDDNSLKIRFENTVFRNLAGTEDMFLALGISTQYSKKANVIGPISKYKEYVEVPGVQGSYSSADDTHNIAFGGGTAYPGVPRTFMIRGSWNGTTTFTTSQTSGVVATEKIIIYSTGDNPEVAFEGTVLSIVPGVSLGLSANSAKPEVTHTNDSIALIGSAEAIATKTSEVTNQWTTELSDNPFAKEVWEGLPVFISDASSVSKFFFREDVDFEFNYPARLQGETLRGWIDGTGEDPRVDAVAQPNITFTNVYLGANEAVKSISPGDIVLLEYQYMSAASRNSIEHNVLNAVDVFVDGTNEQETSTVFSVPLAGAKVKFEDNPTSLTYYENFRRDGEPSKRPLEGNWLTTLFNQPVLRLPTQIIIGENKFYRDVHYWLVRDVSGYAGTVRARDGIEWSNTIPGDKNSESKGPPVGEEEPAYKGKTFPSLFGSAEAIELEPYFYDQNIEALQAALEAERQITTDVLAHQAKIRYFKLDVTVIYGEQTTPANVNLDIQAAIESFLEGQYFGTIIRLSDLLQVIHNVTGVENVRWSNDVPNTKNLVRVYETDINGKPLRGLTFERTRWGSASQKEIQMAFIDGAPTEGEVILYRAATKETKAVIEDIGSMTEAAFKTALETATGDKFTKFEEVTKTPVRSFLYEFENNGTQELCVVEYSAEKPLQGGEYTYDRDFFLKDDELPALPTGTQSGDTVAGLIIRPRAQNAWQRA